MQSIIGIDVPIMRASSNVEMPAASASVANVRRSAYGPRRSSPDVADYFVTLFTNGKVTRDNVAPHTDLLTEFRISVPRTPRTARRQPQALPLSRRSRERNPRRERRQLLVLGPGRPQLSAQLVYPLPQLVLGDPQL